MDTQVHVPSGTIVVGVDATDAADQALAWAIEEARAEQVPLTLVHASGPSIAAWVEVEQMDLRDVIDTSRRVGHELLTRAHELLSRVAPEIPVFEVLRLSGPHEALMELAPGAVMVVVGSHSDGPHKGPLLESAVGFVAQHAPCPVVVPRRHGSADEVGVVVLCDGTVDSTEPFTFACRQGSRRGLPVTVLLCLPDPPPGAGASDIPLMDATARMDADLGPSLLGFERIMLVDMVNAMRQRWPEVTVRVVLEDGAIDDVLGRVAGSTQMLVLGAHHVRRVSEAVIGSSAAGEVRCVTVILPQEQRVVVDEDALASAIGIELPDLPGEDPAVEPGPTIREILVPARVPLVRRPWHLPHEQHLEPPDMRWSPDSSPPS